MLQKVYKTPEILFYRISKMYYVFHLRSSSESTRATGYNVVLPINLVFGFLAVSTSIRQSCLTKALNLCANWIYIPREQTKSPMLLKKVIILDRRATFLVSIFF